MKLRTPSARQTWISVTVVAAASALLTGCGDDVRNDYVAPPSRPAPSVAEMKAALPDTPEELHDGRVTSADDDGVTLRLPHGTVVRLTLVTGEKRVADFVTTHEEQCPGGEVETNDVELQGASFVGTSNVSVAERGEWTGFTCRLEGTESRPDGPAQVSRALALLHRDGLAVRVDSTKPEVTADFLDEYFVRLGA